MQIRLLRCKLHRATVTHTRLDYHGSITIDEELLAAVGLVPFEVVTVGNLSTGKRGETYVIKGKRGAREVQVNGAMARLAEPGDRLIILSFAYLPPADATTHKPKIAILGDKNEIVDVLEG